MRTAHLMNITPVRDYATRANAIKAVEKKFDLAQDNDLRFFIMQTEAGRFFPVFVGERAVQAGVHFHFNVVG